MLAAHREREEQSGPHSVRAVGHDAHAGPLAGRRALDQVLTVFRQGQGLGYPVAVPVENGSEQLTEIIIIRSVFLLLFFFVHRNNDQQCALHNVKGRLFFQC